MGKCKADVYTDNGIVIASTPIMCYGFKSQPQCQYLEQCLSEYGFTVKYTKTGKRRIYKPKKEKPNANPR
jgi:hypothetical protein